jgi:hypothetical protein
MPIYEQVPVRLQVALVSNPPVAPLDQNTNLPPKFWRASAASVAIGIFDSMGNSVDLSNLTNLQLAIQQSSDSLVPLVSKTILAADIIPTISAEGWADGAEQQATFVLSAGDLDLGLGGQPNATFWMALTGLTASGAIVVYVAGDIEIYNPGFELPIPPYGYVSLDKQTNTTGNTTAVIPSLNHTEVVTVNGVARTSAIILPVAGMANGAKLVLVLNLPSTPGIILNIYSGTSLNPIISTITTGSVLNAVLEYYYDAILVAWVPYRYTLPGI